MNQHDTENYLLACGWHRHSRLWQRERETPVPLEIAYQIQAERDAAWESEAAPVIARNWAVCGAKLVWRRFEGDCYGTCGHRN